MTKQLFNLIVFLPLAILGQNTNIVAPTGAYPSEAYFQPVFLEKGECLSNEDRLELKRKIQQNKSELLANNPAVFSNLGGGVLFTDPIKPKASFNDYGYHTINFLVDHNSTPNNNLTDYFCESRTYDWASGNHAGTDYILWPYPWKRMQEEMMEIIAPADGVIIEKRDGFPDMNCSINGNPNWNGIVLEHADGSQTYYLHFKDGSITTKGLGESVSQGEYLGLAGSSGSSNIPHLHFEVYDANSNLIDPYQGACNEMNPSSWWESQDAYYVSKINRISTHYTTAFDDTCGVVEDTYEELNFEPGDQFVLRLFFRDLRNNVPVDITITDPNNDVLIDFTWNSNFGQFYATSWAHWFWDVTNAWPDGVYNVSVDFEGNTYETIFGVNTNLSINETIASQYLVYPNPASDHFNIQSKTTIETLSLYDINGKLVLYKTINKTKAQINISDFTSGVYFAVLKSEGKFSTEKIIKK